MILPEPVRQDPPTTGSPAGEWKLCRRTLRLDRPVLMGILNATPDSFSADGIHNDVQHAVARAEEMIAEGAVILDIGGESTRPGAEEVPVDEELRRVIPLVRALVRLNVPISIDTRRATVARAALAEGAEIVNDVSALGDPQMGELVADEGAGLVLMHMRGTPRTMQQNPEYTDVVAEVANELKAALARAFSHGVDAGAVVLDPGIGFGKTADHNLQLIGKLKQLIDIGRPIMLGVSRKAFLGSLLGGVPPDRRVVATAAACLAGFLAGARIFRVHDVGAVSEALTVANAIRLAAAGPS
ncbi:MAG TPA: dihydropteroate synthase [Longimicrobiaceae bacterium]|nr:dihydropteroate synthase [Longimicrobiaceae bacterium]